MSRFCECVGDEADRPLCLKPMVGGDFQICCDECGQPVTAQADTHAERGDVKQAPGKAPQSGGEAATPITSRITPSRGNEE